MTRLFRQALVFFSASALAFAADLPVDPPIHPSVEHVVLVVWDGMRPDFIGPETTPTLDALAKSGTFFTRHHSVYVTSTEVNGAALATGCYPNRTGIVANREFRTKINPTRPFATEAPENIALGDTVSEGKYLGAATLAEIVQASGGRSVIAGTKPVALLHDRRPNRADGASPVLSAGKIYPASLAAPLLSALGPFPPYPLPITQASNGAQNAWTTKALVEFLWKDAVPNFTTLWLGDPDYSQHLTQPGAAVAFQGIKDSDDHLAAILAALEARGLRQKTDIFVVSDHGFSTVERTLDLTLLLRKAGFDAVREFSQPAKPGEVLSVPLGGSDQLYVQGHDPELVQELAAYLQKTDFCGAIFTHEPADGTFPLSVVRIDSSEAPDLVFSYRWSDVKNASGISGGLVSEVREGAGTHASLSPFDLHNILIAAGPDIREGLRSTLPSDNTDVAPTILRLLGLTPPAPQDGRVLEEALLASNPAKAQLTEKTLETKTAVEGGTWRQVLKFSTFREHQYLDEGFAEIVKTPGGSPP